MFKELEIMKRGSKFCGYSARHFRRIIAASVKNDCELLQSLKKKEAKSCDSGDQRLYSIYFSTNYKDFF